MLLDRKKIRKWAKWVALALAVIFGLSFLFLGVGYGGAGFNLSAIFSRDNKTQTTKPQTAEEKLQSYLKTLEANPKDTTTMLEVATLYEQMYKEGEGKGNEYLLKAAAFLENAIDVDPTVKDVYLRLANIYLSKDVQAYESAVKVLNKAASADPTNPQVFLKLGAAQQALGNKEAAILAWQKYLQLAPNGDMADVVKEQLDKLTATTTTTQGGSTTTTQGGPTTITQSGSTTTQGGSTSATTQAGTTTSTTAPASTTSTASP